MASNKCPLRSPGRPGDPDLHLRDQSPSAELCWVITTTDKRSSDNLAYCDSVYLPYHASLKITLYERFLHPDVSVLWRRGNSQPDYLGLSGIHRTRTCNRGQYTVYAITFSKSIKFSETSLRRYSLFRLVSRIPFRDQQNKRFIFQRTPSSCGFFDFSRIMTNDLLVTRF